MGKSPTELLHTVNIGSHVNRMGTARIVGNTITGNGAANAESGIVVVARSRADIAANDLSGNKGAGVRVRLNSSTRLGVGTGKAD